MHYKPRRRWSWKDFWLVTMALPGAIWLLLIRYLPMLGVVISFKDYKAQKPNTYWNNLIKSKWVGFKNFEFLKSPSTATMIRNTLLYNAVWIVLVLVLAVTLAVMMSELKNRFAAKAYQTMMFFPYFLIGLFVFLALSCMSCLYILEINPLSVVSFAIIFSHSEGCLFTLLIVSFDVQKILSLIMSHLFIFAFISNILGGGSLPRPSAYFHRQCRRYAPCRRGLSSTSP